MVSCERCGHYGRPGVGWVASEGGGAGRRAGLWCLACGRKIKPTWFDESVLAVIAGTARDVDWPSWDERRRHVGLPDGEAEEIPASDEAEDDDYEPVEQAEDADMPSSVKAARDTIREYLEPRIKKGAECVACGRWTKLYHRHLNHGMAVSLMVIYRLQKESTDPEGWVGVGKKYMAKSHCLDLLHGEYSKLKHWGLIEEKALGTKQGFWRLTKLGKDFVEGVVKVKSHVVLKHNRKVGVSGKEIGIDEALEVGFDKTKVLGSSFSYEPVGGAR